MKKSKYLLFGLFLILALSVLNYSCGDILVDKENTQKDISTVDPSKLTDSLMACMMFVTECYVESNRLRDEVFTIGNDTTINSVEKLQRISANLKAALENYYAIDSANHKCYGEDYLTSGERNYVLNDIKDCSKLYVHTEKLLMLLEQH